jgi:hypothetical protein
MSKLWECDNCGWTCQSNPAITVEEAGCDNCGAELMPVPDDLAVASDAWNRFAAAAGMQQDEYTTAEDFPDLASEVPDSTAPAQQPRSGP